MDKRILDLKKEMIDRGVRNGDLVKHFVWSWSYVTALFNNRIIYTTDAQIEKIRKALPIIQKKKQKESRKDVPA